MMECFFIWFPLLMLIIIMGWFLWLMYCDLRYYMGLTQELIERLRPLSEIESAARGACIDDGFDD